MKIRNWSVLILAAVGVGVAVYTYGIGSRAERRLTAKRKHKEDLQTWEGEGGNLAGRADSTPAVS